MKIFTEVNHIYIHEWYKTIFSVSILDDSLDYRIDVMDFVFGDVSDEPETIKEVEKSLIKKAFADFSNLL